MAKEKKTEEVIAPERKRLTELYKIGSEVSFGDEADTVWVQKLTPSENQKAAEAARPQKSVISSIKKLPDDHEAKLPYSDQLDSGQLVSKIDKIKFLVSSKVEEARMSKQDEIASEKEWSDDDYLYGLQEAWNNGLEEKWLEDPEDEEAARVYSEIKRYSDKVYAEVEAEENEMVYEMQDLSEEEVDRKVINKLIEDDASRHLVEEFRLQQIFYATRTIDDHDKRYFESREEIDLLDGKVLNRLVFEFNTLTIDTTEVKD